MEIPTKNWEIWENFWVFPLLVVSSTGMYIIVDEIDLISTPFFSLFNNSIFCSDVPE